MQETKNNGISQHFSSHHDRCSKYSKVQKSAKNYARNTSQHFSRHHVPCSKYSKISRCLVKPYKIYLSSFVCKKLQKVQTSHQCFVYKEKYK